MRIGVVGKRCRKTLASCGPSMRGMTTSVRSRSIGPACWVATSSASEPPSATRTLEAGVLQGVLDDVPHGRLVVHDEDGAFGPAWPSALAASSVGVSPSDGPPARRRGTTG